MNLDILTQYTVLGVIASVFILQSKDNFEKTQELNQQLLEAILNNNSMDTLSFKLFLKDRFKNSIYGIKADLLNLIFENNLHEWERIQQRIKNILAKRINYSRDLINQVNYSSLEKEKIFKSTFKLHVKAEKEIKQLFEKYIKVKKIDYESLKKEVKEIANTYIEETNILVETILEV